jgi:hypothetical protein
VRELGSEMAQYVDLVRQGPRSLKYELSKLVALVTIYGKSCVRDACRECLSSGIVGVDNLELYLKRTNHPSNTKLQQAPITFESEKLNRVHREVDLRKYDALYFEMEKSQSALKEEKKDEHGEISTRSLSGTEAQILEPIPGAGLGPNERSGTGFDFKVSFAVDNKREVGETYTDDSKQNQECKVSSNSNGGEF